MDFETEARTVIQLTAHLSTLKKRAAEFSRLFAASERGYFTPSEEDDVLHLLVSYWQTRNALFEVINSMRRLADTSSELPNAAFVIAYAAALSLVDAARFLYETFDDRSVIRAKLNEGTPLFGIPSGFYDTVQRSLTKLTNSWRLYHATQFYEDKRSQLREELGSPYDGLLDVIDKLADRINVSWRHYAKAKLKTKARQALSLLKEDGVEQAVYVVQEFASRMVSEVTLNPVHRPGLADTPMQQFRALMKPGDVLVTRREFSLTNYFLPGFWPHAALYMGKVDELESLGLNAHEAALTRWERLLSLAPESEGRVLEALKDGVWLRTLSSSFGADALAIVRPKLSSEHIGKALARGVAHDGKAYDFDFDFTRSDRMVCTEVVYRTYEGIGGVSFKLTRRAGRMNLSAEDLLQMALRREHFEPAAVFVSSESSDVITGERVDSVLKKTMGV